MKPPTATVDSTPTFRVPHRRTRTPARTPGCGTPGPQGRPALDRFDQDFDVVVGVVQKFL
ncbi:MAG: hypothetical protein JWL70_730 [Acidimicrobiia bacterium]|nr:hypothetical protein [Acidimicrobiia bacterium]